MTKARKLVFRTFQNVSERFRMDSEWKNGKVVRKCQNLYCRLSYRRRPDGSRRAKKVRAAAKHVHWYRYRYQTFSYSFSFLEPPFWNHSETFWNVLKRSENYEIIKAFPNLADFQRRYGAVWVEPGLPELQKQFTFRCFITRKLWRARAGVDRVKVTPPHSIRRNLHKICTMIGIYTVQ